MGLPHSAPVTSPSAVKMAPSGAAARAAVSDRGWRHTSDSSEQTAMAP